MTDSALRLVLRRHIMTLVVSIALLDIAAIGTYFIAHVAQRPVKMQYAFVGAWTLLTLAIVIRSLARIRAARVRARMAR